MPTSEAANLRIAPSTIVVAILALAISVCVGVAAAAIVVPGLFR